MKNLTDVVKKAALLQIGFISLVTEKVENLIKELEEKGKISQKEGEKFIEELKKEVEKKKEEVSEEIEKFLKELPVATKSEIESLKEEIRALRKEIEELKGKREQ